MLVTQKHPPFLNLSEIPPDVKYMGFYSRKFIIMKRKWYYFNTKKTEKGNTVVVMSNEPAKEEAVARTVTLEGIEKPMITAGKGLFASNNVTFRYGILAGEQELPYSLGDLVIDCVDKEEGRLF